MWPDFSGFDLGGLFDMGGGTIPFDQMGPLFSAMGQGDPAALAMADQFNIPTPNDPKFMDVINPISNPAGRALMGAPAGSGAAANAGPQPFSGRPQAFTQGDRPGLMASSLMTGGGDVGAGAGLGQDAVLGMSPKPAPIVPYGTPPIQGPPPTPESPLGTTAAVRRMLPGIPDLLNSMGPQPGAGDVGTALGAGQTNPNVPNTPGIPTGMTTVAGDATGPQAPNLAQGTLGPIVPSNRTLGLGTGQTMPGGATRTGIDSPDSGITPPAAPVTPPPPVNTRTQQTGPSSATGNPPGEAPPTPNQAPRFAPPGQDLSGQGVITGGGTPSGAGPGNRLGGLSGVGAALMAQQPQRPQAAASVGANRGTSGASFKPVLGGPGGQGGGAASGHGDILKMLMAAMMGKGGLAA